VKFQGVDIKENLPECELRIWRQ